MSENTVTRFLIDQLTEGQLTWSSLDPQHDEVIIGTDPQNSKRYPIMSGLKMYRNALVDKFPEEKDAIDNFMTILKVKFVITVTKNDTNKMLI